jgi:phosphate transport system permease protein
MGTGILTAGLILALMIVPFMSAMFVEIIESVPGVIKEAAYGIGATTYEVFRAISMPYGRTALVGGTMLGLGRALGETMAVTFVIGNANRIKASLFAPGASIASTIANEFPEAGPDSLKLYALLELGFALFVISFLVLALARYLVRNRLD